MSRSMTLVGLLSLLVLALVPHPAHALLETVTHGLTQSSPDKQFWTTPPSERVFKDAPIPTPMESWVKLYAARNEFEPVQVIVKPTNTTSMSVVMGNFGSGITTLLYQVKYVNIAVATNELGATGDYPDPLWPLESGDTIDVIAGENTAIWIDVHVPASTPAGDYAASVSIDGIAVPIDLHVFDFVLPDEVAVDSQMSFNFSTTTQKYGVPGFAAEYWEFLDLWKKFFIDHGLSLQSPLWPGALATSGGAPFVQYDCVSGVLSDSDGIWGFEQPAERYLGGSGLMSGTYSEPFNDGVGFPSFMAMRFGVGDPSADPRPANFCGFTRSTADWYTADNPNSPYNQAWFAYMTDAQDYLDGLGYLDKSYHYFVGEAQDQADYDAAAWYSKQLKNSAPNLRLMIAEEAKPEIFNHPDYLASGQIDIWLSYFSSFDESVSWDRDANHGEASWIYYLPQVTSPVLNPLTLDRSGTDAKLLGWFLWKYRLRGFSQYVTNSWSSNPWTDPAALGQNGFGALLYPPSEDNSNIAYGSNGNRPVSSMRFELIRDGFEDYEYLKLLNGGAIPEAYAANVADEQVDKLIGGRMTITRDSDFIYNLRRLIGMTVAGELPSVPPVYPSSTHPRAQGYPDNYYINFQNPAGEPTANPLFVDGHEYIKLDGSAYDPVAGYGWYAPSDVNWGTLYLSTAPVNELQRSALYSDFGRPASFEFDLPAGVYDVTVSVGRDGRTDAHQNIVIEGVPFVTDEGADPGYLVRTQQIEIYDSRLTLEMGIFGEFTMLNYLNVEGVSLPVSVGRDTPGVRNGYALSDAYPNPFNPSTTITYSVPQAAHVELEIYDLAGRHVNTLVSEHLIAGEHQVHWKGHDDTGAQVASGVYLYQLRAGDFVETKRMVLLK